MLGRTPGPIGTSLGIRRSIATDLERQQQLFAIADAQVVLNDTALRIFSGNGLPIDRVTVNRLAVSGGPYVRKPARPTTTPVKFGAVSRLHPSKGLSELVRAARSLPRTAAFTLDIRGPLLTAADRAYAGELCRLADGDGRISIEAGPPHEQIPALLAQYDVLCCVGTGFENGPTVALEALAVGTPLLATAVGNQNEIIEQDVNGWLVTPGDERALAAAIDEIARRPDIVTAWQRRLPAVRGMEDVARDYETIYANLVARAAA
jgi:glycosyltransferase involved in cell wall biosynthesis